jgi:NADPH:quinone reductase-like Zn-dependent oxidoreductase
MKAYEIGLQTGLSSLRLVDRPEPVAGAGEIKVAVKAACLNYRDLMVLRQTYGTLKPETRIPLSDGMGVVEASGEGVGTFNVGDRVIAPHFLNWAAGPFGMHYFGADVGVTSDGWLAEKIILPASAAIKLPESVSNETAATLSVVGGTVWHGLVAFGQVKPGDLVLCLGTGGVSIFALQLAKAMGAQVAITSSSDAKLNTCKAMGADYAINYRTRPDWAAALLDATGGRGANVVIDTLGFPSLNQTIVAAAVEARIATIGALSDGPTGEMPNQGLVIAKNLMIKGIASGSGAMLAAALDVVAKAGIQTVVDREFAFDDAASAYSYLESGAHLGKVLVRV